MQQDPDDLPFKKGETLTIISKDEEQWWTARNSLGQTGSVPVPYITVVRKLFLTCSREPEHLLSNVVMVVEFRSEAGEFQ